MERDGALGLLQSRCWKILNWKKKKPQRGEESFQKAKTNLLAQKPHRHSALPRPPLFPPHFLAEIKAPGKSQVCKQMRSESQSEDLKRLKQEMTLKIPRQAAYPTSTEILAHLTSKRKEKKQLKSLDTIYKYFRGKRIWYLLQFGEGMTKKQWGVVYLRGEWFSQDKAVSLVYHHLSTKTWQRMTLTNATFKTTFKKTLCMFLNTLSRRTHCYSIRTKCRCM